LRIAPSLLSADFSRLREEINAVEEVKVDLLHFDVMDGYFVPNITFGPLVVNALRDITQLPFDVHLMITNPDNHIEGFVEAGSNTITVHAEACLHLQRTLRCIKEFGVNAGVALNPATSLHALDYVLDDIDVILIMTVNPGFAGQQFLTSMIPKIRKVKNMLTDLGLTVDVEVDGGINVETAPLVVDAGADILVAGTAIFSQPDVKEAVQKLRTAVTRK
jgi:ribulose-phosphate 3-epimerase